MRTIPFNTIWAPHSHTYFRSLYMRVLQRNPLVRIEEKTFSKVGDYHVYVERKNRKDSTLQGVTIYKTAADGAPLRIFADRGQATVNPQRGLQLTLEQGHIEEVDAKHPSKFFYSAFGTYVLSIPFQTAENTTMSRTLREMDNGELSREIKILKAKGMPIPMYQCEKYMRWALAVTPIIFVFLGIPLAVRLQRGGRSIGFGVSLIVILVYYTMLMAGLSIGQRNIWHPALATWLGNIVTSIFAFGLAWRFLRQ